jgi:REP element-mobilizing transposase RayT
MIGRIRKAKEVDPDTGWHSRGYLPHFDGGGMVQFVTFRLANSIPRAFLKSMKNRLLSKQITDLEYHREVERFLDTGFGPNYLKNPAIASIVEENLLRFDGEKYHLLHWVIMPNHGHVVLRPLEGYPLASIVHSIKSYTANRANNILSRSGRFWSVEYYDRYIRDGKHFSNTVSYVHRNPVKAGLCPAPEDWQFGCARRHE